MAEVSMFRSLPKHSVLVCLRDLLAGLPPPRRHFSKTWAYDKRHCAAEARSHAAYMTGQDRQTGADAGRLGHDHPA
jgi:hypothetical protein